jgi:hypothetical protein
MAVTMKNDVFWYVEPCRACINRHFGGTYRHHLQGRPWRLRRYVPPKLRFTQDLHSSTSQNTAFFISRYNRLEWGECFSGNSSSDGQETLCILGNCKLDCSVRKSPTLGSIWSYRNADRALTFYLYKARFYIIIPCIIINQMISSLQAFRPKPLHKFLIPLCVLFAPPIISFLILSH